MSDLICKKDLNRCPTPGMCSPHGGCQPEKGFESEHLDLGKFVDWVWALKSERDQLKAENEALREEIATDDKIIAERDRLLIMFECPEHGQCVPYAMEQVEALRKDAELGRVAIKYIDRLLDPAGDDHLEKIIEEYAQEFSSAMSKEPKV